MQSRTLPTVLLATGALFSLLPAGPLAAQTTPVAITNSGFESPTQADGTTSVGLTGWTVVGNLLSGPPFNTPLNETVLTSNPTNAQYLGTTGNNAVGTMDGSQIASFRTGVLNLVGGSATQITGQLLTIGTLYTLTTAVGNPLDNSFQGYTLSLLSGGTVLASVTNNGVDVTDGTFRDVSLSYTLPGTLPALANTPIIVSLSVPNGLTLGTGYGTDFDNVRLTATEVPIIIPEPSTYASVALGLLGLVGAQYARRRRGFSAALRA